MSLHVVVECILDVTCSSHLLSSKISDIPQNNKYQTIIKPLFEYCFETADDNVWEVKPINYPVVVQVVDCHYFGIDWIRDRTFLIKYSTCQLKN